MIPHRKVYVRLAPSPLHGIGVFAIKDIPKGTNVFGMAQSIPKMEMPKQNIRNLPPSIKKLYLDFCIIRGNTLYCPRNFNDMNISWYLNHSETPNVEATEDLYFISMRKIADGEELTVDYTTYSDF